MKRQLHLASIAIAAVCATGAADAAVILQTASFGGHTYHRIAADANGAGIGWTDAEAAAVTLGGHLATINDGAENDFVFDTFNPSSDRWLWIGLNDLARTGNFSWISGEPVTYLNWRINEPSGDGAGVHYWLNENSWNDVPVTFTQFNGAPWHGIVEVAPAAVPEPGTALLVGAALAALGLQRRRSGAGTPDATAAR